MRAGPKVLVEVVNKQLHTALETRINIEQATGLIAQATGVRMGEAFEMLRRHARSKSTRSPTPPLPWPPATSTSTT